MGRSLIETGATVRHFIDSVKEATRQRDWTCPGLMDTPKSAKVSAEGVNGGEERKAEAAQVFG
jgi:hypothetical protein